jgi:hypothetical protein
LRLGIWNEECLLREKYLVAAGTAVGGGWRHQSHRWWAELVAMASVLYQTETNGVGAGNGEVLPRRCAPVKA